MWLVIHPRYWLIIWGEEFFKLKRRKKYSLGIYTGKIHERCHDDIALEDNNVCDLLSRFIACRSLLLREYLRGKRSGDCPHRASSVPLYCPEGSEVRAGTKLDIESVLTLESGVAMNFTQSFTGTFLSSSHSKGGHLLMFLRGWYPLKVFRQKVELTGKQIRSLSYQTIMGSNGSVLTSLCTQQSPWNGEKSLQHSLLGLPSLSPYNLPSQQSQTWSGPWDSENNPITVPYNPGSLPEEPWS